MPAVLRRNHIFINCPFDASYQPVFHAIIFAVLELQFIPGLPKTRQVSAIA